MNRGHSVTGVDTHSDKTQDIIGCPGFDYIHQDIRHAGGYLDELVQEADLVIDLIAHANPGIYVKRPLDVFRLNFNENLKIAQACVTHGKRLIQFSSCEVYGKTVAASMPENLKDPEDPCLATFSEDFTDFILGPVVKHRWIYSCAKQLLERVLHAHGLEDGLNYTIIRPFNFIGPKIDYLPGETDGGIPRVFSYFMEALLRGTQMQLVNGGTNRRCYTYIDDAVECMARIVENPGGVCDRQIFNIGSPDNEISIRRMAELMCEIYAEKFPNLNVPLPGIVAVTEEAFYGKGYEDSDRRIPDITKARTLLGWEPHYGLREMLEKSMAYYVTEHAAAMGDLSS
jgi:nucleoside-diphosphate-sugar epimerase